MEGEITVHFIGLAALSVVATIYFFFDEETGKTAKAIAVILTGTSLFLEFGSVIDTYWIIPPSLQLIVSIWAAIVWQTRGSGL